jgi:hypothetical protein
MKTPLQKASTVFEIVNPYDGFKPVATVVVIDEERLEREVLKGSIADSAVQKLLPFQTTIEAGSTKYHIVNASAYVVETNSHTIYEGQTLCKRSGERAWPTYRHTQPTCPGCLAKAKAIIVQHLLTTEPELS